MLMMNNLDRYHLVMDVIDRVPGLATKYAGLRQQMVDQRLEIRAYTRATGQDSPAVRAWVRSDVGETATAEGGPAMPQDTGGDND